MTKPVDVLQILIMLNTKLQSFRNINSGGCGVVAAHVAKHLQHLTPTRIVVYNRDTSIDVDKIRLNLNNSMSPFEWNSSGMRWDHVMVEFDYAGNTYLFDSRGVVLATKTIWVGTSHLTKSGYLTIDEIASIAGRPTSWNWAFDRSQISAMKQRIQRLLKKHTLMEA